MDLHQAASFSLAWANNGLAMHCGWGIVLVLAAVIWQIARPARRATMRSRPGILG